MKGGQRSLGQGEKRETNGMWKSRGRSARTERIPNGKRSGRPPPPPAEKEKGFEKGATGAVKLEEMGKA